MKFVFVNFVYPTTYERKKKRIRIILSINCIQSEISLIDYLIFHASIAVEMHVERDVFYHLKSIYIVYMGHFPRLYNAPCERMSSHFV